MKLLYTVLTGDYETPQPLENPPKDYKCILFTDNPELQVKGWDIEVIPKSDNPKKQSREVKINIHKYFKADLYVYIDANFYIKRDISYFVNKYFKSGYLAVKHYKRNCLFKEAKTVLDLKLDSIKTINDQMKDYSSKGMPRNIGLYANGFFVRDNSFNDICEQWYNEVEKHSYRDQLSFTYVLWKNKANIKSINQALAGLYLTLKPHKKQSPINIYHFVPGAGDKNLGRELNKHCAIVPNDEDWILIRDNDTCYLHPYINKQLEDIILKHGKDYELFSCVTNRLGLKYQLPYGLMDETDVLKLRELADEHYEKYYDEVVPSKQPTAGLFMLFQKKTWKRHKFDDGLATPGSFIDWRFTNGLLQKRARIGICKGIFLFHYYRMHQENAREYKHLLK